MREYRASMPCFLHISQTKPFTFLLEAEAEVEAERQSEPSPPAAVVGSTRMEIGKQAR